MVIICANKVNGRLWGGVPMKVREAVTAWPV